uniref:Tetratricopeptide repeat domain 6 n=1 Tax=Jaculus jaculus TaxID=51337 RepID=A0A8C5KL03_JACJA
MSSIPKHFGLKPREESYIFKELEKVRRETKKEFLLLKQHLASRLSLDESPAEKAARAHSGARLRPLPRATHHRLSSSSSVSVVVGEDSSGQPRRVRIHTHFLRQDTRPDPRATRDSGKASPPAPLLTRAVPTCIEEIIASLQSEAQLASDQTIKELIGSVLGQHYDITVEDISLMQQMYLRPSQMQLETPQMEAEPGLQINVTMHDELPEDVSSVFQDEQEDMLEWKASEVESVVFKSEDIPGVQLEDDLIKPLEDGYPKSDLKTFKRPSVKVESSEFLKIRGKEVKQTQKCIPVILPPRQKKPLKPIQDEKLIKKIPQAPPIPHHHDLCTTVPADELPVELRLASRMCHTLDKKGHCYMLGQFRPSFLGDCSMEEQRDRCEILYGVPVKSPTEDYANAPPFSPEKPPEQARKPCLPLLGEEISAYPGFTKLFWNLTAPKFAVPESVMRETLYPKYESAQTSKILTEKFLSERKESEVVLESNGKSFKPFILRKSASYENIPEYSSAKYKKLKRPRSTVELRKKETTPQFVVKDDTLSNIKDLQFQKEKEQARLLTKQKQPDAPSWKGSDKDSLTYLSMSLIEASRKAGISYIVYPRKRKKKWKKGFAKIKLVYEKLSKPPRRLKRSTSHGILPGEKKCLLKVPLYEIQERCPSVPVLLNFDKFVQSKGGIPGNTDPRTWAFKTFTKGKQQKAPTKPDTLFVQNNLLEKATELPKLELSDSLKCTLPREIMEHYQSEVERLTEEINNKKTHLAFAYCRRGAIYRKLGKLQSALDDLQKAIFLEPLFLNAYWHRHFIYLYQDKINEALDDLNYIHKYNKNNAEAYLSKAEIFREKKDFMLAILNYTQAIKCRPTDADIYFRRGEMYEKTNRVLAMDDYAKCIFYSPQRKDALMKRGVFYFENENWIASIQDFTALIKVDPQNSQARMYRGRAYSKRNLYRQAIQDLSASIHLDPNNWLAFYYRACLFRKNDPHRALQDYSVSALINDGYENFSCFLHRGLVYAHLKLWWLAICDFETVISLERTVILAYINIGLIYLLYLDNYTEAFWKFSDAIKIDPLYIQSYICRAETYHKMHSLKRAVNELSRAIHLQPDGLQLYIIRGQYLLSMKSYELAKFTIYQIAEMNKGLIELSPIQQALIYSFCENHEKAIQVLDGVTSNRPEFMVYALLAKVQMKAKKVKEAVKIFKKALEMFSSSDKGSLATFISADCLYNLGLCYMEEGNLQMAFDSFTKSVKANPEFAEAFYQRGLCKVKLQKDNSVIDFNRAITINPKHYQAYLSRVAYYGLKGRFSKAILNCNEAIRIYPEGLRAYLYRGVLKYYNKCYKLAVIDLTTAVNMNKNSYIAFYNRAMCYTKIRELQKALMDFGTVLLLDPGETVMLNTFINRGLIYNELGQYGFALEDFKQGALISQTNVSHFQATAICHHRINEFEEAVDFFTRAIKINSCFLDAYIGRGNSYMEYENNRATKLAQKDFVKALHLNPTSSKARISLGYNLQAQGKFQKAWTHFTIAVEVDPKSYLAFEGRSVVCLQMSNHFAAMQDMNTALKINTTAEFLTNRGVIHEFMGQQQNAMKDYQAAISLDPTYSLAYFNAGNIYFHHRQFSQARDYFSKAFTFDPENDYALMNRAVANTILEKYEEAKQDFSCAVEHCPHWAAIYFNRAYLYYCLKQYELAEEDLSKALSLKPSDPVVYSLRAEVRGRVGRIKEAMSDYNQTLDLEE